ncbi:Pycsar system effector family protein [Algoriphagus sp. A40]|uniref:Pycsar system effector family protein n=1 Tax=Algoriphagus sp. A40 TaxID=1945863 RepID=UPI0009851F67|nr:Pycsar system effector family protein [Algoriphagus sp. A40]OOG78215.1 HD family phosphohydrolase [Algoriphagus sp. A40]
MDIQSAKFESWIRDQFAKRQKKEICYHNLEHTSFMVEKVREMGEFYQLGVEDQEDLAFAAWLHDVGYWDGKAEDHEVRGAEVAQANLGKFGLSQSRIDRIKNGILTTQMPQTPRDLFESILCDADLYHLGTESFYDQTLLLKCEIENNGASTLNLKDWLRDSREFANNHIYHTSYAQRFLEPVKKVNLKLLDMKIEQLEVEQFPEKGKKKDKKEKKGKKDKSKPERGVETLFRVTSTNHMELSAMADTKANIMISVNSIIISIVVTILIRKLEEFPNYTIPAILLISTCLIAMVFAILATRPKVTKGVVTKEDISKKEGNLLYFGNFYQMSLQDYTEGMNKMLEDSEYLYGTMTRDIYYLGRVLSKKYLMLRKSYNVFMFGFIISVIAFLVASLFFESQQY